MRQPGSAAWDRSSGRFLGYGIQPTEGAEWGYDIQRAVSDAASGIWWTGLFPGLAIVLLVTGLTLLGESLNEDLPQSRELMDRIAAEVFRGVVTAIQGVLRGESLNETINPVLRKRRYEKVNLAPPGVAEAEME